jgi:DNA-binding response OmpR family regulator
MDSPSKPARVYDMNTLPGYLPLLYVDPEATQRDFADAVFRGEYAVESAASIEEVDDRVEVAVIVINLSDAADPNPAWEKLTHRWPSVPVVVVLSSEAASERDREALWALGPASIVVNPLAPGALRHAVAAALS